MMRKQVEVSFDELIPMIEDSFRNGLTVTLPITGSSMRPLLWHKRDSVVLSPCDPCALKRGDVPLYRRENGQYVLHRILRVDADTVTLVGDAQTEPEIGVPKDAVCAVMTGFIRKGKAVDCRSKRYRLFVTIWLWCCPIRPFLFKLWKRLRGGRK